jgi:hypothetical protein
MMTTTLDWTNKNVQITDIRKLNKVYLLTIHDDKLEEQIKQPLFVKNTIFEGRLKSYFITGISKIPRGEILSLKWNMHISKGYFIKVDKRGNVTKFENDPNKWYISYLEIDGYLGSFSSIYRDEEIDLNNNEK